MNHCDMYHSMSSISNRFMLTFFSFHISDDQFWKKSGDDPRAGIPSPSAPSNPFSPMV